MKNNVPAFKTINNEYGQLIMNVNPNSAEEQVKLAGYYQIGYGVPRDDKKAEYWFTKAAEQGFGGAQKALVSRLVSLVS